MKELKFSTSSWHYKLSQFLRPPRLGSIDNLCSYIWSVIWGGVRFSLTLAISIFLMCVLSSVLGWIVAMAMNGMFIPIHQSDFLTFFGAILLSGATVGAIVIAFMVSVDHGGILRRKYHSMKHQIVESDGFIATSYRSIRDKTCFKVTFEEARNERT